MHTKIVKIFLNYLLIFVGSFFSGLTFAQNIVVRDAASREPLENVIIQDKTNKQSKTNIRGIADISSLLKGQAGTPINLKIIHLLTSDAHTPIIFFSASKWLCTLFR